MTPRSPGPHSPLANMGEALSLNARLYPDRIGARDLDRALTFRLWNARANRLANALLGLGLAAGDRVAVLAYNALEWLEIYPALAKAGLVAVPVNFRLAGPEMRYILEDSGAHALILEEALAERLGAIRAELAIPAGNHILFGARAERAGYRGYEALLAEASDAEPRAQAARDDLWALMYTSGTTGRPKGAKRSHRASALLSLVTEIEMRLSRDDTGLLVMPLCHANSLYFAGALLYCGAPICVYSRRSFEPEHLVRTLAETRATFTSLVPTHYTMMLELAPALLARYPADHVRKLLVSSAPARRELKQAIMERFRNSGLYELYGSTEAGWVTMLHPEQQLAKLGSVGRECIGTAPIRLLDEAGNEVGEGAPGELHSRTPYTFDGYWNLPAQTADAFRDGYCSVGDMARRDADGFYYLVDRKSNMIISGGENVYPSEVEGVLCAHPSVRDAAVVGLPDAKWGERVHAVIVLHEGAAVAEAELLDWCRDRIAGYKRPRSLAFIAEADMPRTATGKIQHRILKRRLAGEPQ